jgi:hypothetical protein
MTAREMGSAAKNSVLQFFLGEYFSVRGSEFASPHYVNQGAAHG